MKIHHHIFDTLRSVALANESKSKMAAALVKGNYIVSIGYNRLKSDPLQAKFSKNSESIYLHAEIHAIKNALRELKVSDLKTFDMYICRVKKLSSFSQSYVFGMAHPCCGCQRAIAEFGIRNVIYTKDCCGDMNEDEFGIMSMR